MMFQTRVMTKSIFKFFAIALFAFSFAGCQNESEVQTETSTEIYQCPMDCEDGKTYDKPGSCPVCKMDLTVVEPKVEYTEDDAKIAPESIFNLTSNWTTQHNDTLQLVDLKGDVLVVVMIYTSCQAACPRLVADMRNIDKKVNDATVKYVLVSIDPETDTPEKMLAYAKENHMEDQRWVFLNSDEDNVRELSNVLSVRYKEISPIDFSHSNIISVFNKRGVLHFQQEGLGVDNSETVEKIMELTK